MMEQFYRVPLRQLVEEFNLKVIYQAPDYEQIQITAVDINRAGMQLTGFFEYFEPMRLQDVYKRQPIYFITSQSASPTVPLKGSLLRCSATPKASP